MYGTLLPMERQGRACVIGARGALGGAVVAALRAGGWTVHPTGRRAGGSDGFRHLDLARPDGLGRALGDVDLAVSAVADPNLVAERWVLEHGGVLVNCSHASGAAAAALTTEIGARRRGTVLLNAGLVPGLANLAAAELLDEHPDADALEVAFTVLGDATAGRGGGEFIHAGLASRSRHRVVRLPFPEPFGELSCIEVHEGEDCGFAGVAGGRRVENYVGFADPWAGRGLRLANSLGLMRLLPRAPFVAGGERGEVSREPTVVWLGARRGERRLGAALVRCDGDYRTTAEAARAFGEALVAESRPGCFNPEDLFRPGDLATRLRGVGWSRGGGAAEG